MNRATPWIEWIEPGQGPIDDEPMKGRLINHEASNTISWETIDSKGEKRYKTFSWEEFDALIDADEKLQDMYMNEAKK